MASMVGAGCSDDLGAPPGVGGEPASTERPSTTVPVTAAPTTTAITSEPSAAVPTSVPTAVPTAVPATTTTAGTIEPPIDVSVAGGWALADLPPWAGNPCCATPWPLDEPSPALPAPDAALPDGVYRVEIPANGWSPYRPEVLHVRVSRFDRCGDVAEGDIWCEAGLPVDPDEIGERRDQAIEFVIPLDSALSVGLTGTSCTADGRSWDGWVGDGDSLQALWSEIDAVFETWVRPSIWAGGDSFTVMSELAGSGAPFTANACIPEGQIDFVAHVSYTSPSGPTLLFQTLGDDAGPLLSWRLFDPVTIEARAGRLVLYLERAWKS
jgi:hypothetical protein